MTIRNNIEFQELYKNLIAQRDEMAEQAALLRAKVESAENHLKSLEVPTGWKARIPVAKMLSAQQQYEADLIVARKREAEQRDENQRAKKEGRKPTILYPVVEQTVSPKDAVKKELESRIQALQKLEVRLTSAEAVLAKAAKLIRDEDEREAWAESNYTIPMPKGMVELCARWAAEANARCDTVIPLSGDPWYRRPGHEEETESEEETDESVSSTSEEMLPPNWAPSYERASNTFKRLSVIRAQR